MIIQIYNRINAAIKKSKKWVNNLNTRAKTKKSEENKSKSL